LSLRARPTGELTRLTTASRVKREYEYGATTEMKIRFTRSLAFLFFFHTSRASHGVCVPARVDDRPTQPSVSNDTDVRPSSRRPHHPSKEWLAVCLSLVRFFRSRRRVHLSYSPELSCGPLSLSLWPSFHSPFPFPLVLVLVLRRRRRRTATICTLGIPHGLDQDQDQDGFLQHFQKQAQRSALQRLLVQLAGL